jgi:protein TonB
MMRDLDIRGWAIPILLALLLNAVLFFCIPSLSSRKEMKKAIDFPDPIFLSNYELSPPIREIKEMPRPPEEEEPPKRVPRVSSPAPPKTAPAPPASAPVPEKKPIPKPSRVKRPAQKVARPSPVRETRSDAAPDPIAEPGPVPDSGAASVAPSPTTEGSESGKESAASDLIGPTTEMGVGEVDQAPVALSKVEPAYPPIARRQNREGKVVVRFLVDAKGRVQKPSIVEANPKGFFERSVLEAIGKWRFKPGQYRGRAVSTWIVVPIYFKLTG